MFEYVNLPATTAYKNALLQDSSIRFIHLLKLVIIELQLYELI
jgi:hypothetical protein